MPAESELSPAEGASAEGLPPMPLAPPPRRRGPGLAPWIFALAAIALGWAVAFLYLHPTTPSGPSPEAMRVDALTRQMQALGGQVQGLAGETKQLAARPVAQPQSLAAMQKQLDELAARKPPAPNLGGLESRIAALEQRKPPSSGPAADLAPVQKQLADLGQRVAALSSLRSELDRMGQTEQALATQVQTLTAGAKNTDSGLADRLDAQSTSIAALKAGLSDQIDRQGKAIAALQADMSRVETKLGQTATAARAEAALSTLQAGLPLGAIPNAPPAVARFATEAPPTVTSLRAAFPEVAQAALAASRPNDANQPLLNRMWTRAQNLVTVQQGDHVLVGDPAAGIVARARAAIDSGDVAGAADALGTLTGPAAKPVAGWLGSAKALLAARGALLGMAGQA